MERRKFTREFKLEAVRLIKDRGVSYVQASQELGVHASQLRDWVKKFADDPQHAFPGHGQMKPEQLEIARLKHEVAKLKAERDILKKAAVEAILSPVRDRSELQSVIAAQAREPNGGLIVMPDSFMDAYRVEITSLAARYRLPAVYPVRFFAEVGGLLSYGVDRAVNFRRAATYVDRILKGEKPAELPVQTPTKYELVINLKTAKALGLEIPPALLARADEVIE